MELLQLERGGKGDGGWRGKVRGEGGNGMGWG